MQRMYSQLSPQMKQRAMDYVTRLLELQREQGGARGPVSDKHSVYSESTATAPRRSGICRDATRRGRGTVEGKPAWGARKPPETIDHHLASHFGENAPRHQPRPGPRPGSRSWMEKQQQQPTRFAQLPHSDLAGPQPQQQPYNPPQQQPAYSPQHFQQQQQQYAQPPQQPYAQPQYVPPPQPPQQFGSPQQQYDSSPQQQFGSPGGAPPPQQPAQMQWGSPQPAQQSQETVYPVGAGGGVGGPPVVQVHVPSDRCDSSEDTKPFMSSLAQM